MSPDEDELPKSKSSTPNETLYDELYGVISDIDNKLDSELIKKYFSKGSLFEFFKYLKSSYKKDFGSAKQVLIETNLAALKNDIRNMPDDEVRNKKLDLIAHFVEKITDTVKKINNQEGQGLKIITPKQMITRLPILLAQL